MTPIKPKTCRCCKAKFTPSRPLAVACSPLCALTIGREKTAKAMKEAKTQERKADAVKREGMKNRADWLREAKVVLQARRRLEELAKGRGCMSCQRTQSEVIAADGWKPGGAWDGGHFMSKGARPELALEPLNIWLQCKSCNGGSKYARKGHTVAAAFEQNLAAAEGQELVDWLKGPHELKHYTEDELKALKAEHAAAVRELKRSQA